MREISLKILLIDQKIIILFRGVFKTSFEKQFLKNNFWKPFSNIYKIKIYLRFWNITDLFSIFLKINFIYCTLFLIIFFIHIIRFQSNSTKRKTTKKIFFGNIICFCFLIIKYVFLIFLFWKIKKLFFKKNYQTRPISILLNL